MTVKSNAEYRVLFELLETAKELVSYALVPDSDIAQLESLCGQPSTSNEKRPGKGAL